MGNMNSTDRGPTDATRQPKGNPTHPDHPDALKPAPRRGVKQDDPLPEGSLRPTPRSPDQTPDA